MTLCLFLDRFSKASTISDCISHDNCYSDQGLTKVSPQSTILTTPINLSSRLFSNVLVQHALFNVRTELKILLLSSFDSPYGIPVEANQPLGSPAPIINLTRPAVLRIYYGQSKSSTKSLNSVRPTYGPISSSSSVGMDPNNFSTKPMTWNMCNIAEEIRLFLIENTCSKTRQYLQFPFNHCTVLVYSGDNNNGRCNSSLAFHSDCTFDHNGNYVSARNSQRENTCVAVLTLGDSRRLHFRKRVLVDGKMKRKRWALTDDKPVTFNLTENSVFLLHPEDEIPTVRRGDKVLSQYLHGDVNITNSNDLSVAFAFRVVCVDREYDPITSKLIPKATDIRCSDRLDSESNIALRNALCLFRSSELHKYAENFHSFVSGKFREWQW